MSGGQREPAQPCCRTLQTEPGNPGNGIRQHQHPFTALVSSPKQTQPNLPAYRETRNYCKFPMN